MARRKIKERGTIVDLFCGCGGFSLGAELAGFHSLAAIDIDPTLQSAYRRNFSETCAIEASVAHMEAMDWRYFIGKSRPDGLIGGPPCQGFSWIGRRRKNDPRNTLIHDFYRQVRILRPKFFIMENVDGLLSRDNIGLLTNAIDLLPSRYRVLEPTVVNAADFGAATSRRRAIVVGYDPGEVDPLSWSLLLPSRSSGSPTVRDAIADLPSPIPEVKGEMAWAKYPSNAPSRLSEYARRLRKGAPAGIGCKVAVERQREGYVSGAVATQHSREIARRYAVIPGGKSDPITKSYKLEWDGQCPTLRAGTGADRGAFQAVRPLHPGKGRVITVREAARLQGFPDWFAFHNTKWHSFRMIGNSISPIVARSLLTRIKMRVTLAS